MTQTIFGHSTTGNPVKITVDSVETPLSIPFKLPAKTDVKISAVASATGVISTMMIGWMETA